MCEDDEKGLDPLEFISRRNSKFKDQKKVDETNKRALLHSWIEVENNEGLMDEYISSDDDKDQTNSSMITKREIKIGDEFLKILHDNSFNTDKDELRLHVFSKSLSGDAEKWWNTEGTTTTWKELCDKLFHKYYPLSHTYKSKIRNDLNHATDYFEFLYWLASKFDNYWELDKNIKSGLWEFYVNQRTKGTIDDLVNYNEPCDESNEKTCSDLFFKPYLDAQDGKDIYKIIDRDYSPIPIPTHHDNSNLDKLCQTEELTVVWYSIGSCEEFITVGPCYKEIDDMLERDQDYPIDVIMAGLTLARHATEGAEAQPDYFLKPDVAQLQVPIFARPRDILNPFALEKEILLKESLEAHAIRLAKKKGVKGKAILCGVGAAHIPRSDGVPVSVATMSPKDSELLGKLEEAGDAAYQVGSSDIPRAGQLTPIHVTQLVCSFSKCFRNLVKQQPDGIFISQDKYVADILKKFDFLSIRTATTPIESNKPLAKDEDGVDVDVHVYKSMIGSLMYLTASRPDIMFAVCACLWYTRDSPFVLEAFSDSDYGGASLDRKSTTEYVAVAIVVSMDLGWIEAVLQILLHLWSISTKVLSLISGQTSFWQAAISQNHCNGTSTIVAFLLTLKSILLRGIVRSKLQLADATGIHNFSDDVNIYAGLISHIGGDFVPLLPTMLTGAAMDQGNTSGSTEAIIQLKELMVLVPNLVTRVTSLEKELKETKQTLGNVVLKLVKKVKSLEIALKRKFKKVIVSKSEGEEPEDQGRIIQDIDDDPLVSLVRESMKEKSTDFVTPTKALGEAQEEEIRPTILVAGGQLKLFVKSCFSKC
ncbi:hypothetical protein Tco_0847962 [Tanacetum coccineum]